MNRRSVIKISAGAIPSRHAGKCGTETVLQGHCLCVSVAAIPPLFSAETKNELCKGCGAHVFHTKGDPPGNCTACGRTKIRSTRTDSAQCPIGRVKGTKIPKTPCVAH